MADHPCIWLTRPEEDSELFAKELGVAKVASLVGPTLTIKQMPFDTPPEKPHAILITSRHATSALAQLPSDWQYLPVYCVGVSTAKYVREFGFSNIIPGNSNVLSLLPRVSTDMRRGSSLVYFAGEDRKVDVSKLMKLNEIHVNTVAVYHAVAEPKLPEQVMDALHHKRLSSVAFFSSRSATVTIELMKKAGVEHYVSQLDAFCMSLDVANAAGQLNWKALHVCHRPTRIAMHELIVSKLSHPSV